MVPCRNEKEAIEACVRSILAQEVPSGGLEIIVADGMSDDGTREILDRLAGTDPRLRIVDNPKRTTPCARNAGIQAARGSYIAILDAHTEYSPTYIRTCLELLLEHPEVCCAGGPIVSRGKSRFGQAVAVAMSHPLGVGNAKHRFPDYEGYAEGACFPMFRRGIFEEVGLFDEELVRNQDDEFNLRIARNGGKIFISPRARCVYFVREAPSLLFRQYFQYGYWRVAVLKKHQRFASLRQAAPTLFFALTVFVAGGVWYVGKWRFLAPVLPLAYGLILISAGARVASQASFRTGLLFPAAAAIMHFAYAAGFACGVAGFRSHKLTRSISR